MLQADLIGSATGRLAGGAVMYEGECLSESLLALFAKLRDLVVYHLTFRLNLLFLSHSSLLYCPSLRLHPLGLLLNVLLPSGLLLLPQPPQQAFRRLHR